MGAAKRLYFDPRGGKNLDPAVGRVSHEGLQIFEE